MRKLFSASLLLLLVFTFWITGCEQSPADKEPEFSFPKVNEPYLSEQAIKNGDVVNLHGKYFNIEKWQTFLRNMEVNQPYKVRITQYTIEGDPIFYELTYDGNIVHYIFDNSMDAFGSDLGRPSTSCKGVDVKKTEEGQEGFVLKGCDNTQTGDTFWFVDK